MKRFGGILFALILTAEAAGQSAALASAHADLRRLPADAREPYRYLRLDNVPADDREKAYQALAGHMQHLSTATDITPPAVVAGTAGALLRVNLDDYGMDHSTWEQLADADPYDHVRLEIVEPWPGGIWDGDGIDYAAGSFTYKRQVSAFAPWLSETPADAKMLEEVARWTHSRAPVVRGDWFFNQTAAQQGRKPGYYDFLGIKDKRTFEALAGFDAKRKRRKIELREAVGDSGVTLQPRALAAFDADEGGVYYYSIDFKRAVDRQNPLRVLGRDIERNADAFETYARLPNGFWFTGAFNGKGQRQDTAPGDIANDHRSKSNDKQVHVNVSCTRCHDNGGLKDVDGWARNLLAPPLALNSPDYDQARLLRQQYLRDLGRAIDRDRKIFSDAVREATGLKDAKEYAALYAAQWEHYEDAKVDAAWAARDLECEPEKLKAAVSADLRKPLAVMVEYQTLWANCYLAGYAARVSETARPVIVANGADVVLAAFVLDGQRRRTVGIRQWEEAYPLAKFSLKGVRP